MSSSPHGLRTAEAAERTSVLAVVGAQRTGSTLIATTLGMLPGAVVAGELRLLWASIVEGRPCACLRAVGDCPVWSRVVERTLDRPALPA